MKKHYQQQQAPQMQMEGTLLRSTNLPTNKVIPQAP